MLVLVFPRTPNPLGRLEAPILVSAESRAGLSQPP